MEICLSQKILFIKFLSVTSLLLALSLTKAPTWVGDFAFAQTINGSTAVQNQNQNQNQNRSSGQESQSIATYENRDFGFKVDYPASWILREDNLHFSTVAAFQLIHTNIYDFTNTTLAEIDIRVFNNPRNLTANNITINDINTPGKTIISMSNTTVGPLRAFQIVDYTLDGTTTKHMQVLSVLPKHNLLFMIYYIVNPSLYDQYLPVMEHMLNSFQLIKEGD